MDKEQAERKKTLKDLDEILKIMTEAQKAQNEASLPPESPSDFSDDPMSFEEGTAMVLAWAEEIYQMTGTVNRHSEKFIHACDFLSKAIKYLGSACITRAVLEQHRMPLPKLKALTTDRLIRMVSFNMRKCDTALREEVEQDDFYNLDLLNLQFRYHQLLGRLKSTEEKIQAIQSGKLNTDKLVQSILDQAAIYPPADKANKFKPHAQTNGAPRGPQAFPMNKSVIRESLKLHENTSNPLDQVIRNKSGNNNSTLINLDNNIVPEFPPMPKAKATPDWMKAAVNKTSVVPNIPSDMNKMFDEAIEQCAMRHVRDDKPAPTKEKKKKKKPKKR